MTALYRSGRRFGRPVGHVMTNNFSGYASHSVTSTLDRLGSDPVLAIRTNGKAERLSKLAARRGFAR